MYHLSQMWTAMKGSLTATLATLSTMIITLCVLGIVMLVTLNLEKNLTRIESEVEITLFLKPDAKGSEVMQQVKATYPQLSSIKLVTKEDAMKEMANLYPYFKETQNLVQNPLPDAIRLKLQDPRDTERVAKQLEQLTTVQSAEYGQGYMQQAINFIQLLRTSGWVLVGILIFSTFFNILNTVRVAMYARQQEINVMRMLGATPNFIRMPYILEGLLLGIIASLTTCALLYPSYMAMTNQVSHITNAISVVTEPDVLNSSFLKLGLFGVFMGLLGSFLASYHYLREIE